MQNELKEKLTELALSRSLPFCYGCYKEAPTGTCLTCFSDDLMRLLPSVGCEYGLEWIVEHILETELTSIDTDEAFEYFMREIYPETTQVGFMIIDTVQVMKDQDPICWKIAQDEWIEQELEVEQIISFDNGSTFYKVYDLEELLE